MIHPVPNSRNRQAGAQDLTGASAGIQYCVLGFFQGSKNELCRRASAFGHYAVAAVVDVIFIAHFPKYQPPGGVFSDSFDKIGAHFFEQLFENE